MSEPRFFQRGNRVTLRPDRAEAYGLPRGVVYTVLRTYPHKRFKRTWVVIDAPRNPDGTEATVDSRELRIVAERYGNPGVPKVGFAGHPDDVAAAQKALAEYLRAGITFPSAASIAKLAALYHVRVVNVERNPGVPDEGPIEHLKNAAAILQANLELGEKDALVADDAKAVLARIKTALRQLEDKRVDIALPNHRRRGSVRRGNPSLMVLGANPRVDDATIATWAKIEYRRPDDPDGDDVIRVHEFKDGFEIGWLSDGSVQLSHPRHRLWTEDEIGRA